MKYHYRAAVPERAGPLLYRPTVEIEILGPKGKLRELALIDSGAERSMLNTEMAEIVGIDLTQATTRKAIGITGATTVYLTEVELKLDGARGAMHIPVAFIDSPYASVLLSQDGFFDRHRITFEKHHQVFANTPVKKT
jgi:Aspartyl protease